MNILVVRMRQMGDAILATSLLNTLRVSFPDACIDFVLQERIAPLFQGHPSIDHIVTFTDTERHNLLKYINKVWRVVHATHYDIIIDMRGTNNTMLFALLSPHTKYRISLKKWYTWLGFNYRVPCNSANNSIVVHDLNFTNPLIREYNIERVNNFTLHISDHEIKEFGEYMRMAGIDLAQPLLSVNVTARLPHKIWAEDRMTDVLQRFISHHPHWQIVFNYAPGAEEDNARRIYCTMGCPEQIKIDVQARSPRQLAAMGHFITLFFGNEGGARHIMQAVGCPSIVIFPPENDKHVWVPKTDVPAHGIAVGDYASAAELAPLSRAEQYNIITADAVYEKLCAAATEALAWRGLQAEN